MRNATLPRPAITPQSPKEPEQIEAGITRAEIEEYFLYDSIDPLNRKRRMSRRMATHLRKMVCQAQHKTIAKMVLPPGWYKELHVPKTPNQFRLIPDPFEAESIDRHREIIEARHRAVMRLVAMEQAKAKGGANR